jgi:spore coat protein A
MDRRTFLKTGSVFTIGIGSGMLFSSRTAWAFVQSAVIPKFVTPLRRPGTDIPIAESDGPGYYGAQHYTLVLREFRDQLLPKPNGTTRLWGYTPENGPYVHLGGIILARRGTPIQITFRNELPPKHILPVDTTIMGAEGAQNRAAVHLHGGKVPWVSDGGPHAWFAPDGERGESYRDVLNILDPSRTSAADSAEYFYPNNQGARTIWYHDHALGITRLNAYAGLASAYILTDDYEDQLIARGLPGPVDARTHYLIFQDKIFVPPDIAAVDPKWMQLVPDSQTGDLWYPHTYETERWEAGPAQQPPPDPSVVAEAFGDTILVNGTSYPYLTLEARVHRLRLLNACNARFLNPRLVYAQAGAETEADTSAPGPGFIQIGTEGGFLPSPVKVNQGGGVPLLLAPAERADLLVDLRQVPAGSFLILYSDAPAPFPAGDMLNDFERPFNGPNTRTLLQIRVKAAANPEPFPDLPKQFTPTDPFLISQTRGVMPKVPPDAVVRRLTLNEAFDRYGRLIQFLGTDTPTASGYGRPYDSFPTEVIKKGQKEVWEIANLTGDTHPIHFHLVNVQILSRQRFSDTSPRRGHAVPFRWDSLIYLRNPIAPDENELGWKETVRMNPGEVTRVLIQFDLPVMPFKVPLSTRTGVDGHEYVWHCHILEHEEHDMMRPLIIIE